MALTRDYYTLADICNDDYSIMAKLIKNEVGREFKYAKILLDLDTSAFSETIMDKYNTAISRALDRPMEYQKKQIAEFINMRENGKRGSITGTLKDLDYI
jgi:hypothetical protein